MRTTDDPKFRMVGAKVNERDYRLLEAHVKRTGETAADFVRRAIRTWCVPPAVEPEQPDPLPETTGGMDAHLDPQA